MGILVGVIIVLGVVGFYYFMPNKSLVLNFIKENPDKTAIKLVRNDTVLVEINPNKVMPLASTVKIIIAIEYAEQAAAGKVNPEELIEVTELDKYYVPNTDGGAHPSWLKKVENKIQDDRITIREIAKGMIAFSSNANTEWLCEKLGLENINGRLDSLGVKDHTDIYYIVSALFIGKEKFANLKNKELQAELSRMPIEEYRQAMIDIHSKLKTDST